MEISTNTEHTFTAKHTHSGQYKRYGDSYFEWDVTTDADEASAAEWCLHNLAKPDLPRYDVFRKATMSGGEKSGDYSYYFRGYYTIRPITGGYHFTICKPYTD